MSKFALKIISSFIIFALLGAGLYVLFSHEMPVSNFKLQIVDKKGEFINQAVLIYDGPVRGTSQVLHHGLINLKNIPAGSYQVSIYAPTFEKFSKTITFLKENADQKQIITLEKALSKLGLYTNNYQVLPGNKLNIYNYSKVIDQLTFKVYRLKPKYSKNFLDSATAKDLIAYFANRIPLSKNIIANKYFSLAYEFSFNLDGATKKVIKGGKAPASDYPYKLSRELPLAIDQEGLYLIQPLASSEFREGKIIEGNLMAVLISPYSLFTKSSYDRQIIFAANLNQKTPVKDASLYFYDINKQEISLTKKEHIKAGLFDTKSRQTKNAFIIMLTPEAQLGFQKLYPFQSNDWDEANKEISDHPLSAFWISDRPLYRPGDTISAKGIVFERKPGGWDTFKAKNIEVKLFDPEYQVVATKSVGLKDSALAVDFELSKNCLVGQYRLQSEFGSLWLKVEEFKKPKYQVSIDADKTHTLPGDKVTFEIKGNYFFGAPLAKAKVNYTLYSRNYSLWTPWWSEEGDGEYYEYEYGYGDVLKTGKAVLDEAGQHKLEFTIPQVKNSKKIILEVNVTDESGKSVISRKSIFASPTERSIYSYSPYWSYTAGSKPVFNITVRNYLGEGVKTDLEVKILDGSSKQELFNEKIATNEKGELTWAPEYTLKSTNGKQWQDFRLVVSAVDARNNKIEDEYWFYIYNHTAQDDSQPKLKTNEFIDVKLDKNTYADNDQVKAFIFAGDEVNAVVSLEGNDVFDTKWVQLKKGVNLFEYKINKNFLPYAAL
ncbi:MAG: hypothetical protein KKA19_04810, partial [Candidatus Margulisbacteria bacterium]|nr:hypothetical protein [Candidatus Margulisiibacteriota bacterium]